VQVTFDPQQVSYAELLDVFWSCHDPSDDQRAGPHESIIFFHNAKQEALARASRDEVAQLNLFKGPILTRIVPAAQFFRAEEYHQQYVESHGTTATCHVGPAVVHTRLAARARK
jgi:peptide-methionine (S)-S-oxide reductase